jgi:flagellar biosynthesis anti-sigma factor FlgM
MRIDSSYGAQPLPESQTAAQTAAQTTSQTSIQTAAQAANVAQSAEAQSQAAAAGSSALGEDQAQLSGTHAQVQALVGQALQLPEIRQEKVQALRQAVVAGKYQPSASDVAGALLANNLAVNLAA